MYSIWLIPERPTRDDLLERIESLSGKHGTPMFAPHVTVIGDMGRPLEELCEAASLIADCTVPITAKIRSVTGRSDYFTSLTLDMPDRRIAKLHGEIAAQLALSQMHPFHPHLSLAYGLAEGAPKAREVSKLMREVEGNAVTFDSLEVVHSAKSVPVENWRSLRSFPFKVET